MDPGNAAGVLGGEGRDGGGAVAPEERDGLEVGLDTRSAAGVAACDGEHSAARVRHAAVEQKRQFGRREPGGACGEDCGNDRDGIGAGVDDRAGVVPVDAADGDDGEFHLLAHEGERLRSLDVLDVLGLGGVERAEPDVVGAGFLCGQSLFNRVGGDADELLGAERFSRRGEIAVLLPEVYAVRVQFERELQVIVHDELHLELGAQPLQVVPEFKALLVAAQLVPILQYGDAPRGERFAHARQQAITLVRNQVKSRYTSFPAAMVHHEFQHESPQKL